jgi:hypothetical protein
VVERGDYTQLGELMIAVVLINMIVPLFTVAAVYWFSRRHGYSMDT